jgi:HK97 family phage prohead protease
MTNTNLQLEFNFLRKQRVQLRAVIDQLALNLPFCSIHRRGDLQQSIRTYQMSVRATQPRWDELNAVLGQQSRAGPVKRLPIVKLERANSKLRAYAPFITKSISIEERIIEGLASSPSIDHFGDVVDFLGAQYKLPMPLLWIHNHEQPVGNGIDAKPSKAGIRVTAQLPRIDEPGKLKDLVDLAWQSVKHKLVTGLSLGFRPLESSPLENGKGFRFTKYTLHEISLVTVAANSDAAILSTRAA